MLTVYWLLVGLLTVCYFYPLYTGLKNNNYVSIIRLIVLLTLSFVYVDTILHIIDYL